MQNRVLCNEGEVDFFPPSEIAAYHDRALASLLKATLKHPMVEAILPDAANSDFWASE